MSDNLARIDANGRILLPASIRRRLGLEPGDTVVLVPSEDGLQILSRDGAIKAAQRIAVRYARPGEYLSDELIQERRAEAAAEAAIEARIETRMGE